MNLPELHRRLTALAIRRRTTLAALISEAGIRPSTLHRAAKGNTTLDTATGARLLPLISQVVDPGEPVALYLTVPGVAAPLVLTTAPL